MGITHYSGFAVAPSSLSDTQVGLTLIRRHVVQFTPPALAASAAADSTYTVTGATTNSLYLFSAPYSSWSTQYNIGPVWCSSADEVKIRWQNRAASTIGTGESTNRGALLQIQFSST